MCMRKVFAVLSIVLFALCLSLPPIASARTPLKSPPENDGFTDATVLTGTTGTSRGSNVGATRESWEGNTAHARDGKGRASIWYTWVAPASGEVEFNTAGSNFDTVLAIYTWPGRQGPLDEIVYNDDPQASSSRTSRVTFTARQNTRYYIAVDGYSGATGQVRLNWKPTSSEVSGPVNDNRRNASAISGTRGRRTGSNVGAAKESWETGHAGYAGGASIWYSWVAPANGKVEFDTVGSNFDTLLAIYTWPGGQGSLHEIASNDDPRASSSQTSRVDFAARQNTKYYIAVDGYNGATGQVVLNWKYPMTVNAGRPADVAQQFEYSGSPLTVACSSGNLEPGRSTPGTNLQKPVRLALCTEGFNTGPVDLQLVLPNGGVLGLPRVQGGSLYSGLDYVVPVFYSAGVYQVKATQGTLSAVYTFRMVEATSPNIALSPDIRVGENFRVYVAGFPPSTGIQLCFYQRTNCPPLPGRVQRHGRVCYTYIASFKAWTEADGTGTYSFGSPNNASRYALDVQGPNGAVVREVFNVW